MSEKPFQSTDGDDGETVALTNVENKHFKEIREWIEKFFDGKQVRQRKFCMHVVNHGSETLHSIQFIYMPLTPHLPTHASFT